jgi:hypothetical protein
MSIWVFPANKAHAVPFISNTPSILPLIVDRRIISVLVEALKTANAATETPEFRTIDAVIL